MDDGRQHFTRSLNVPQDVHICTFGPFGPFSFRRLSRREARALKPWRIAVQEVGLGETVEGLVSRHFPTVVRLPRLTFRVLNGLPRGEPRAGDRVKLIVE